MSMPFSFGTFKTQPLLYNRTMKNADISIKFRRIRQLLRKEGEVNKFRLMAYDKAANQIELLGRELAEVLPEGLPAFHEYCGSVPGIGEKSREKIVQLIQTGSCDDLTRLEAAQPAQQDSFFSDEEMGKTKRKSSKNHRAEVTAVRRPIEQCQEVVDKVLPVLAKYFEVATVCGSYRRGKATVKDIDVAITGVLPEYASEDIEMLFTRVEKDLGIKETDVVKRGKAQTAFYHPSTTGDWHVDFWYAPPEEYGAQILFATGCAEFNIEMRKYLKIEGLKLNRRGLYKRTESGDVLLAQRTEEDIFTALGLEFVAPEDRLHFNPNAKMKRGGKHDPAPTTEVRHG